jgi:hypothetical protein
LGRRRAVAIAAHLEVRDLLNNCVGLTSRGLKDVLIGSYARDTGIWPGKDVDVFAKLTAESVDSIDPGSLYKLFYDCLLAAYGDRVVPQNRSIKVCFGSGERGPALRFLSGQGAGSADLFDFAVDVVPAVRWADRWAIPSHDPQMWGSGRPEDRWVLTDPEQLTVMSSALNTVVTIGGQGAFVPTVKAIKQIRKFHLGDQKPGGLYFEFMLHEAFGKGEVSGDSWADVTGAAIRWIGMRLLTAAAVPVIDPVLGTAAQPQPDHAAIQAAISVFTQLSSDATEALAAPRCEAGALWRGCFGTNGNPAYDWVFPVPPGCTEDGGMLLPASIASSPLQGSNEARGFGARSR